MYMSRVEIDINNRQKLNELDHLGAYHSWVENSFPLEINDHIRSRKLWRVDNINNKFYLIVVSQSKPNLNLLEKYGVENSAQTRDYSAFLDSINNGQIFTFKIVLNPTYSISSGKNSGKRGRIVQCIGNCAQIKYLEERSLKNGFELVRDTYRITQINQAILRKSNSPYYLTQVCYEGRLIVKDKDEFLKVLVSGMGHKKAYGCGLMTII